MRMAECVYYRPLNTTEGECLRDRPTYPTPDGRVAAFPRVRGDAPACALSRPASGPVASTVPVTVGPVATQVAALDPSRMSLVIANDSGAVVYVKYGPGASASSWTHRIEANKGLVISGDEWYGLVTAARGTGTSVVLVTTVRRAVDASW